MFNRLKWNADSADLADSRGVDQRVVGEFASFAFYSESHLDATGQILTLLDGERLHALHYRSPSWIVYCQE